MYYFAYGSNLNRQQMLKRCPNSQPRLTATLHNYKLVFAGWSRLWRSSTASIKPFRGECVLGGIYEISDRDLRRLDKYEGYPYTYDKLKVTVYRDTDDPVEAITYIMRDQSEESDPSPEYKAAIKQSYRDWGLV
ncbi:MAG: gamma-glutamylcyclotransferase family protein [Dehalococcoidales bacterium]|jgi:cation transport regulator ChaC|nr:gamma-glutamylcyclotransferase family protein [Dehalococcoidales bacterium]